MRKSKATGAATVKSAVQSMSTRDERDEKRSVTILLMYDAGTSYDSSTNVRCAVYYFASCHLPVTSLPHPCHLLSLCCHLLPHALCHRYMPGVGGLVFKTASSATPPVWEDPAAGLAKCDLECTAKGLTGYDRCHPKKCGDDRECTSNHCDRTSRACAAAFGPEDMNRGPGEACESDQQCREEQSMCLAEGKCSGTPSKVLPPMPVIGDVLVVKRLEQGSTAAWAAASVTDIEADAGGGITGTTRVKVHFKGKSAKHDEWVQLRSPRIQTKGMCGRLRTEYVQVILTTVTGVPKTDGAFNTGLADLYARVRVGKLEKRTVETKQNEEDVTFNELFCFQGASAVKAFKANGLSVTLMDDDSSRIVSSADDEVGHIVFKRSGTAVAKTDKGTEVTVNIKVHSFTHVLSSSSGVDIPIPPIGHGQSSDGSSVHYADMPANDAVLPSKVKLFN